MATFRWRVARLRQESGLSQAELAAKMSDRGFPFHQQTIQKVENGSRAVRLDEAKGFADCFGMAIDDLIEPAESEARRNLEERVIATVEEAEGKVRKAMDLQRQYAFYLDVTGAPDDEGALFLRDVLSRVIHAWADEAGRGVEPDEIWRAVVSSLPEVREGRDWEASFERMMEEGPGTHQAQLLEEWETRLSLMKGKDIGVDQ